MQKLFISFILVAFLGSCTRNESLVRLRLGHVLDVQHPVHLAMKQMAEALDSLSSGSVQLDIYPSQQLGSERELLELLQVGSVAFTKVSTATLEGFDARFKAFGMPYIFRDDAHRFAVMDSDVGRSFLLGLEPYRLRGLAYYDAGSRSFYTKDKPIRSPDDLKGLKIRTQSSPMAINLIRSLGGAAAPISFGELYTALQQGVVDGAENNPPSFYFSRQYEVAKFYSLDEHSGVPDVLLISLAVWRRLSAQQRDWVERAALSSAQLQRQLWKTATDSALARVQRAGVSVVKPNKKAFIERTQALYASLAGEPELQRSIKAIQSVGEEYAKTN